MPSIAFRDANRTSIAAATSLRTALIMHCFETTVGARSHNESCRGLFPDSVDRVGQSVDVLQKWNTPYADAQKRLRTRRSA